MEMDYEWHRRMFVRLIELGHFWNKEISESGALFRSAASDCICFEVDLLVYLYKESFLESIDMLRDYLISVGQLILTNITEVFLWYWYLWISMSLLNNLKAPFVNRSCYYNQKFPESKMNFTYEAGEEKTSVMQGIYQSHSNPATPYIYISCALGITKSETMKCLSIEYLNS